MALGAVRGGSAGYRVYQPEGGVRVQKEPSSKVGKAWAFFRECIVKEFGSCLRHSWCRVVFWLRPNIHGLDCEKITPPGARQTAKVALFLHGSGGHQSAFMPMAKECSGRCDGMFTASLAASKADPVPVAGIRDRIGQITALYKRAGYKNVEFALVGHSLGAIAGAKLIYLEQLEVEDAEISMLISLAGRLKLVAGKFFWFCNSAEREVIGAIQERDINEVRYVGIRGALDEVVPAESVLLGSDNYTAPGYGHGGIVFAPGAHRKVATSLKSWSS